MTTYVGGTVLLSILLIVFQEYLELKKRQVELLELSILLIVFAVEEAKKISAFVTQKLQELMPQLSQFKKVDVSRYFVKAVPVYLEPESARELLDAAIRKLSEDVSELAEKIKRAEEERNKKALARLSQDYSYRRNLLEAFKKVLESLPT